MPEPGECGRMRQSAASAVRPLQCQPPIVLRPGPAPCPAVARTGRNLPWHCWREYPPRHEHSTPIQAGPPMTLGNMRANGVQSLAVSCHLCHHRAILSADP
jgi:hypothetical protein